MKHVIWKFALPSRGVADVTMPKGAEILSVQNQHESVQLWARCDPDAPFEKRRFVSVMTGEEFHSKHQMQFIDTVQLDGGADVAHVFEVQS